jgi:biopolymer transport protein ExbB
MLAEKIFTVAHLADQVVLWILLVLSVLSIGMILERFFALRKVSNESKKIRGQIRRALETNSPEDVENIARDINSVEGRAAGFAMKHMKDSGSRGLEEIFNSYALTERPELEKFLGFLATVGANSVYVGLFGTVLGIMKAFNDLATAPEAGQQTVMAGISMALVATAAGLFVAIPAVISYNVFTKQVRGIMHSLDSVKELCLAYAKKKGV